jgi:phage terminase large subunit
MIDYQRLTRQQKQELLTLRLEKARRNRPFIPEAFCGLWKPYRHKCFYGGRGSGKSWSIARALIWIAHTEKKRILCAREFQSSIRDSVHRLLKDQIASMGLSADFHITENAIVSKKTGSEFLFKGLHLNAVEIKSTEGVDICWVEEAEVVSADSWKYLLPTIRKPGSEIWISWNPEDEDFPTDRQWVKNTPPDTLLCKVSYRDNPFFSKELDDQRRYMESVDADSYEWVWEGNYRKISEAAIFAKKVEIRDFDTPEGMRFFHGADWGFANDPTALIRFYEHEQCLYIDMEAYGYGVELDELGALFDRIPTSRNWPIKADCSRPETISYVRRQGFNIDAADKWPGSVEDGITHIKGFRKIIVHQTNCPQIAREARLYSYKVDKKQLDDNDNPVILPIPIDANNHGWDAVRYGLDGYIQNRGGLGVWAKLAE